MQVDPRRVLLLATLGIALSRPGVGQRLVPIGAPNGPQVRQVMPPRSQTLAIDHHGDLWLLARCPSAARTSDLALLRSNDGGDTWRVAAALPTPLSVEGSISCSPVADEVHVVWNARDAAELSSVWFATLDTTTERWSAAPQALATATGKLDQYYVGDIATAADGTIVVAFMTDRAPPPPVWQGSWNSGIIVRPAGARAFGRPMQTNTFATGGNPQVAMIGSFAHVAFLTWTGSITAHHRTYSLHDAAWVERESQPISDTADGTGPANRLSLIADAHGGLYCLYEAGRDQPGGGRLRVAYAPLADRRAWRNLTLCSDGMQIRGNVHPECFSLARGPGELVTAIYSKADERHQTLYVRELLDGLAMGRERSILATGRAGAFARVNGIHTPFASGSPIAAVSGAGLDGAFAWLVRADTIPRPRPGHDLARD